MSKYPNRLRYYIWGFQVHFRISCQTLSEAIFNQLDRGLSPKVYLLGIGKGPSGKYEFLFDPEDIESWDLNSAELISVAKKILSNHPRKDMFYSGPGQQEKMDNRLVEECYRQAIEEILNNRNSLSDDIFFVSEPVSISRKETHVVLSLNRQVYESHLHLRHNLTEHELTIYRSIIEAAVTVFLEDCKKSLYFPNPGESLRDNRPADELLRESAKQFMYTISTKGKAFDLHGLFNTCNALSTYKYEGNENNGHIIIASNDDVSIRYQIKLQQPFAIKDIRKARKMLQLSTDELGLVCNSNEILGIGKISSSYDSSTESIFSIKFKGIHCWEIWHGNTQLLAMNYGMPQLPFEVIGRSKFFDDCKRLFGNLEEVELSNLYNLAMAATKQSRGALLVFSPSAEAEAARLAKQCIAIEPVKLNTELVLSLTSIDGGVLLDPKGTAYAHGVILDGIVHNKGDAARGSRYNSAVTYFENTRKLSPVLIVVVSEDGTVDLIPNLLPRISKVEIQNLIDLLVEQRENFESSLYNRVMKLLRNREFYLSEEQCDLINSIKREIERRPLSEGIRIVYGDLHPNPDMDDSFLY